VFKNFLKYLAKPRKYPKDKIPTAEILLAQREYTECERKREVTCEIMCLDIKCSANDSLTMLVFKFNNSVRDKTKGGAPGHGDNNEMMMHFGNMEFGEKADDFALFKQNSDSVK
jgi:hypothetical protein